MGVGIEVENLSKVFGQHAAVSDLNFCVPQGEIIGFLGANGAGKTTTLRLLSTYLKPTRGTAKVAGFDVRHNAYEVRQRIGYLPESPPLYGELTVEEYLFFLARLRGFRRAERAQRVSDVIEKCFLGSARKKLCCHLSRGFRQRVGLAQAILHDPEVIILDEPTSGLDPQQIVDIRRLISELRTDHTVLMSTHVLAEVSALCDRVIIIHEGSIALEGKVSDLECRGSLEDIFLECVCSDAREAA